MTSGDGKVVVLHDDVDDPDGWGVEQALQRTGVDRVEQPDLAAVIESAWWQCYGAATFDALVADGFEVVRTGTMFGVGQSVFPHGDVGPVERWASSLPVDMVAVTKTADDMFWGWWRDNAADLAAEFPLVRCPVCAGDEVTCPCLMLGVDGREDLAEVVASLTADGVVVPSAGELQQLIDRLIECGHLARRDGGGWMVDAQWWRHEATIDEELLVSWGRRAPHEWFRETLENVRLERNVYRTCSGFGFELWRDLFVPDVDGVADAELIDVVMRSAADRCVDGWLAMTPDERSAVEKGWMREA